LNIEKQNYYFVDVAIYLFDLFNRRRLLDSDILFFKIPLFNSSLFLFVFRISHFTFSHSDFIFLYHSSPIYLNTLLLFFHLTVYSFISVVVSMVSSLAALSPLSPLPSRSTLSSAARESLLLFLLLVCFSLAFSNNTK